MMLRKFGAATIIVFGAALTPAGDAIIDRADPMNPYSDKGTHYELDLKADIDQGERVEIAKDRAAMTLKGWNDEYAITIEPQIPTTQLGAVDRPFVSKGNRPLLSKKMEYKSGDVTAFIEPRDTGNEFDIDFTLHSKPDTNVFTYKIEGAEQFDFFYQPELTAEEIAEGASRPDNVVGSYAVYHKTKANHRVGDTNYATGKAFHIYRPKAVDANGAEVWAELGYADRVLTVMVPQQWLQNAAYPVHVDPTFGYTTAGASNTNFGSDQIYIINTSSTESGDVTKLTASLADAAGTPNNGQMALYLTSDYSFLSSTVEVAITNTSQHWEDFSYSVSQSVTAQNYTIAFFHDASRNAVYFDTDVSQPQAQGSVTYNTWPDPLAGPTNSTRHFSFYATYTASGGGGATPQDDTYFEVLSSLILFQIAYALPRPRRELI